MRFTVVLGSLLASVCCVFAGSTPPPSGDAASILQSLPVRFEPARRSGEFEARGLGYRMSLSPTGGQVEVGRGNAVGFQIQHGNSDASFTPSSKQSGTTNYFLGKQRRTSVPGYGRVTYGDVLPGIDVTYYGANGQLEFDFVVQPGADPSSIAVKYSGQKHLTLDADGNLVIDVGGEQITQKAPAVFQRLADASIRLVAAGYELRGDGLVGYQIGSYDHSLPLVIDPILVYANYVGGSSADAVTRVVRDSRGRLYVAGTTASSDFIVTDNTLQLTPGGSSDAFLMILDPGTNQQLYSTFFGGSGMEKVTGLGVDSAGRAYLTGVTASSDFPLSKFPSQGLLSGTNDAFFVVIDPAQGADGLIYSTYMGGSGTDTPTDMAVRPDGTAVIAGYTDSTDFPMKGASAQSSNAGSRDGFVAVYDIYNTFTYSTYLGGSGTDYARAVAFAADGSILVTGTTISSDFPVIGLAYQSSPVGNGEAFLVRLSPDGAFSYSSYFGGEGLDEGTAIVPGPGNKVWLAGYTLSSQFPLIGASVSARSAEADIFVAGLDLAQAGNSQLFYSTLIGGSSSDVPYRIANDGQGGLILTGYTTSLDFPVAGSPLQPTFGGGASDAFVVRLDPTKAGSDALTYSSYLGGRGTDIGYDVLLAPGNRIVAGGATSSRYFPTANPTGTQNPAGIGDGYVVIVAP